VIIHQACRLPDPPSSSASWTLLVYGLGRLLCSISQNSHFLDIRVGEMTGYWDYVGTLEEFPYQKCPRVRWKYHAVILFCACRLKVISAISVWRLSWLEMESIAKIQTKYIIVFRYILVPIVFLRVGSQFMMLSFMFAYTLDIFQSFVAQYNTHILVFLLHL